MSTPLPKDVIAHKGLLFRMLHTQEADALANSYGLHYAEQLVRAIEAAHVQPMKFQVQELRPEVLAFALLMEARLREKDADKGQMWKDKSPFGLSTAALAKASFVQTCIAKPGSKAITFAGDLPPAKLALEDSKHVVDVANFCMMLADVSGVLDAPVVERKSDNGGVGWVGLDQVQMS